jgi:hypothetical protein
MFEVYTKQVPDTTVPQCNKHVPVTTVPHYEHSHILLCYTATRARYYGATLQQTRASYYGATLKQTRASYYGATLQRAVPHTTVPHCNTCQILRCHTATNTCQLLRFHTATNTCQLLRCHITTSTPTYYCATLQHVPDTTVPQ